MSPESLSLPFPLIKCYCKNVGFACFVVLCHLDGIQGPTWGLQEMKHRMQRDADPEV